MATQKKLLNPRGYISWSQLDMWERSRDRYIRKYFLGDDTDVQNGGITFGKEVSEALENGEAEGADMEALLALLPHYTKREHEIRATLNTKAGSVDLLGKLDTFGIDPIRFREYKTGRIPWTQAKAEKHGQIRHYATLIYLAHGKVPTEAWLDWAETEEVAGEVSLTGKIRSFQIHVGMGSILEYMVRVGKVAQEIDAEYRKHLKALA